MLHSVLEISEPEPTEEPCSRERVNYKRVMPVYFELCLQHGGVVFWIYLVEFLHCKPQVS